MQLTALLVADLAKLLKVRANRLWEDMMDIPDPSEGMFVNELLCYLTNNLNEDTPERLALLVEAFYSVEENKEAIKIIAALAQAARDSEQCIQKDIISIVDVITVLKEMPLGKRPRFVSEHMRYPRARVCTDGTDFMPLLAVMREFRLELSQIRAAVTVANDPKCNADANCESLVKTTMNNASGPPMGTEGASSRFNKQEVSTRDRKSAADAMRKGAADRKNRSESETETKSVNFQKTYASKISTERKTAESGGKSTSSSFTSNKVALNDSNSFLKSRSNTENQPTSMTNREAEGTSSDNEAEGTSSDNGRWITQTNKRFRKPRVPVISGARPQDKAPGLKGVPRKANIYVGRCDPSITKADIKTFLVTETEGLSDLEIFEVPTKSSRYVSFCLRIPEDKQDLVLNPEMWDCGIEVRLWQGPIRHLFFSRQPSKTLQNAADNNLPHKENEADSDDHEPPTIDLMVKGAAVSGTTGLIVSGDAYKLVNTQPLRIDTAASNHLTAIAEGTNKELKGCTPKQNLLGTGNVLAPASDHKVSPSQ